MHEILTSSNVVPLIWGLLGVFLSLGMLATIAPRRFAALTEKSGKWVDTDRILAAFDQRYDIDRFILPHARVFGAAVVMGVATLAFVFWNLA
jgi:hypothetical protein